MKIIRTSVARTNFQEIINEVYFTKQPIIISKSGKPKVIIRPLPEDDKEVSEAIERYLHAREEKKKIKREEKAKKNA